MAWSAGKTHRRRILKTCRVDAQRGNRAQSSRHSSASAALPLLALKAPAGFSLIPRFPEEERRELVAIIRKEADRLNRVLSDVIDFAQPRRPIFRRADLAALVDDVIRLARDKGHGHVFRRHIPPNLPALRGDSDQLRMALLNLVMNLCRHRPVEDRSQ